MDSQSPLSPEQQQAKEALIREVTFQWNQRGYECTPERSARVIAMIMNRLERKAKLHGFTMKRDYVNLRQMMNSMF